MNRRKFLKWTGFGLAAGMFAGCKCMAEPAAKAVRKPNFVFLLVDDLGWTDLGCFGSKFYETPNVDRLASEGMRFTSAYAACPVCSPTRASIMTGKYPTRMQTTDYFGAPQPDTVKNHWTKNKPLLPAPYKEKLPLEETTLAEALKQADYATFFAGKWHLGPEGYWPENQGFDINKGGCEKGHPSGYFSPYGNPRLEDGPKGEHLPDRLATETAKFIEANKDKPFLAYLSFYSVHIPLMSRKDLQEKYEQKKEKLHLQETWDSEGDCKVRQTQAHPVYGGMVEAMDLAVGKVLDKVKALGLENDTIVIFMSDNGGLSTSEGSPTSNLPLRGGKGWLYEGGIREPMIIKWPGVSKPGSVCGQYVISMDFYPTMLETACLPAMPKQHLDGMSMVPLLKGGKLDRGPIFWHYPHYGNQGGSPGGAVRDGKWKLLENYEKKTVELYDLENDIGEKQNLAANRPQIVKQLQAKLEAFRRETGALMPAPNPAYKKQ